MAKAQDILTVTILELLAQKPEGLEVDEILEHLGADDGLVSPRGVRNLLKRLAEEKRLIKRKRHGQGRGKPPYAYFHPKSLPEQLNIFENILETNSQKSHFTTRTQIEQHELNPEEQQRQQQGRSVLERIAENHLESDAYAKAIIDIAPVLAEENPIDLIVNMALWVVEDLNKLGDQIENKWRQKEIEEVRKLTARLDERLKWAKNNLQRFWRFDRPLDEIEISGILDLPAQARYFFKDGERASFNQEAARERLENRVFGDKLIEERTPPPNPHKAAVGTDASIAKIFLNHTSGSFIPPDPVIVTTSAAAMVVDSKEFKQEYQDFDIFPDKLHEYENYRAAVNGLLLSPELMRPLGEEVFKRSQIAAMELRQYSQDFRVSTRDTKWRPVGEISNLGINPKPTLIFRDGRVFPVVHRINFYESDNLYGQIVRNQIQKFADVIHNTLSSPMGEIIYGAAVKNPELSWLAPLVFWYLHVQKIKAKGQILVDDDNVYKTPFADTAVSHLLFLGLAKQSKHFAPDKHFITCQVLRRFSDIAFVDTSLPLVISEKDGSRLIDEEEKDDWMEFISQRIQRKEENYEQNILDESDYAPFIYICHKVGTLMCYAAPTSAYEMIVSDDSRSGGHFLIPRLEVAINLEKNSKFYQKYFDKMLSWLAAGHWELDRGHTQSGFDTGQTQNNFPVLVPDVILYADEAARFARDKLSDEVEDEIRKLIAELRKRIVS
ncbi:hypothetical protein [Calothrix sp. CCY 0018]|uniref:hypothetical protein n=1 Tax=Calothrix sp. CCY 0018 TaxID=3103864 RepID=UPI0039C60EDE